MSSGQEQINDNRSEKEPNTSCPLRARESDVDQLLQTGLADFSLRELLGLLISTAGTAERSVYLAKEPTDKPNGFYDRSLQLGTIPIDVRVPRSRSGCLLATARQS